MDILTIILQLLFGWAVRSWPVLAKWPNRLIPIFNAILAALVQLAAGTAHAADSLAVTVLPQHHHGHPGWFAVWQFLQPVLLNTLLSTGIFSSAKNVGGHFQKTPHEEE